MTDDTALRCRHFLSYSGVKLPLQLVTELETAQLGHRNTFFRGYYDDEDRLVHLEKVVYGEVELKHRYEYHPNGQLRWAEITDVDGEQTELEFDEAGAPL